MNIEPLEKAKNAIQQIKEKDAVKDTRHLDLFNILVADMDFFKYKMSHYNNYVKIEYLRKFINENGIYRCDEKLFEHRDIVRLLTRNGFYTPKVYGRISTTIDFTISLIIISVIYYFFRAIPWHVLFIMTVGLWFILTFAEIGKFRNFYIVRKPK